MLGDTGIAVKDSSNATIKYLDVKNSTNCINLYRKKQEFAGAIANLIGTAITAVLASTLFFVEIPLIHCLIVSFICGIIGQFGDLAESLIKRNCQVKDSGSLMPGHGGVLDRIDSLLFAGPVFYCYYQFFLATEYL